MAKIDNTLSKIVEMVGLLDKGRVSTEDFTDVIKVITQFAKQTRDLTEAEAKELRSLIETVRVTLSKETEDCMDEMKGNVEKRLNKALQTVDTRIAVALKEQADGMDFIYDKVGSLKDGTDGKNGKDGKDGSPDTAAQIANKLESLKGDERLSKEAVRGIEDIEKRVKDVESRPTGRGGGSKGVTLYVNGVKKLLTAQTINITGPGVTYNYANGRNDITITGGGSFSILTATGTIDDSNKDFTFASEPKVVVVNGATYRHGAGCTISGTNVTLDNPVGVGGDIYGIG